MYDLEYAFFLFGIINGRVEMRKQMNTKVRSKVRSKVRLEMRRQVKRQVRLKAKARTKKGVRVKIWSWERKCHRSSIRRRSQANILLKIVECYSFICLSLSPETTCCIYWARLGDLGRAVENEACFSRSDFQGAAINVYHVACRSPTSSMYHSNQTD